MKKLTLTIAAIVATLTLTGCSLLGGGSDTSSGTGDTTQTYTTGDYEITVPKAWQRTTKAEFTSDIPKNTDVTFSANRKNEAFLTNVAVTKNILSEPINTLDYAKIVLENQKNLLLNYVEKSRDEIDVNVGGKPVKTWLVSFEGKRTATDPVIGFTQLYLVKDKTAYIATGAYITSEDSEVKKEADTIVRSLTVK